MTIEELIPYGEEHAISRKNLTSTADDLGLIPERVKDKDRCMRALVADARTRCAIVSAPSGGYYRPTKDDLEAFRRYIEAEDGRAKQIFNAIKYARGVYEDMRKGLRER